MSAAGALKTKRALIAQPVLDWDCRHYPYRQIPEIHKHNARADLGTEWLLCVCVCVCVLLQKKRQEQTYIMICSPSRRIYTIELEATIR